MEDHQLGDTSAALNRSAFDRSTEQHHIPEPNNRAEADSFLTSLDAEPWLAWAIAGDILRGGVRESEEGKGITRSIRERK